MSTITIGSFLLMDALFGQTRHEVPLDHEQTSPDFVVFRIKYPDGETILEYETGDPEVTNPVTDYWECNGGLPPEVGEYRWEATGYAGSTPTGETVYGTIFVIPSDVDSPAEPVVGPTLGPCQSWIEGEDVARCARVEFGSNPAVFNTVAFEASMALYEISGRTFTGLCSRTVRPCRDACSCGYNGPASYGAGPWYWAAAPWGGLGSWAWYNERGDKFGCAPMSRVNLAGYPVRFIDEVRIGGVVLPEFDVDTDARNWRLDKWRYLIRMDTPPVPPATSPTPQRWPGCQNMSLDDDQPGTFAIDYRWGVDPPSLGRGAATELANQLYLSCGINPGAEVVSILPTGTTRVVRQGVEIERGLLANWLDPTNGVGLVQTDLFLQAYAGGQRRGRRGAVWSPDRQGFARRVGTYS